MSGPPSRSLFTWWLVCAATRRSNRTKGNYMPASTGSLNNNEILRHRRPVMNFEIRTQTIKMSKLADEVVEAPLRASIDFVNENKIDFVTHGSDWSEDQVESYYGEMNRLGKLKIVPHTPGISTSDIIRAVKSRDDL